MSTKPTREPPTVALLWHGDREARRTANLAESKFRLVAEALSAVGVRAVPAVYNDDLAHEVHEQLLKVDGVLVWVNPIEQGRDRTVLDGLLRDVSEAGIYVSAHPDTILKMGTKEVLYRTRDMTWGSDTYIYASASQLRQQLLIRLAEGRPRVLKQHRGNGGNGVWKVERQPDDPARVRVRHALRGSVEENMSLGEFLGRCEAYFAGNGRIIDQPYQERLTDGMVRCYLVGREVAGFGHQEINALYPAPPGATPADAPQPGQRLYYPATDPRFRAIKAKMEREWVDGLCESVDLDPEALPLIWDTDLLYGPRNAAAEDTYVLCEINVSSVYPFPDSALEPLARATRDALAHSP